MARRQPRKPSIGLNSCELLARGASSFFGSAPIAAATSAISSSPCGRNSCSGGSSSRIVTGRPLHDLEQLDEIAALHRQELGERRAARSSRRRPGSSRAPRGCGPRRRTCARCGRARCLRRRTSPRRRASAGVSALARTPSLRTLSAQPISVPNSPDIAGSIIGTRPASTWPVEPSMVMSSPRLSVMSPACMVCALVVDAQRAGARDAGLAHAARDHRRMRGHAAARGEDAFGGVHAVDVLRRGLDPHQDDLLAVGLELRRLVGREHDLAGRRARRGRQAGRDHLALGLRIDGRMQQAGRARPDRSAPPPLPW